MARHPHIYTDRNLITLLDERRDDNHFHTSHNPLGEFSKNSQVHSSVNSCHGTEEQREDVPQTVDVSTRSFPAPLENNSKGICERRIARTRVAQMARHPYIYRYTSYYSFSWKGRRSAFLKWYEEQFKVYRDCCFFGHLFGAGVQIPKTVLVITFAP